MQQDKPSKQDLKDIEDCLQFIPLSKGYRIEDFSCIIEEYSAYLKKNAFTFHDAYVSKTHLLVNKKNGDIVAYMVLVTDSIKLSEEEKIECKIESIPFGAFPALKIGKLAVAIGYSETYKGIGSLMIELARGMVHDINEMGVACKFITIDADIEHNPTAIEFYIKNGFRPNEKHNPKNRTETISMRLDVFNEEKVGILESTGTEA